MDTSLSAAVNEKLDQQFLLLLSDAEAILKEDALARSKSEFFNKVKVKQSEMSIECFTPMPESWVVHLYRVQICNSNLLQAKHQRML